MNPHTHTTPGLTLSLLPSLTGISNDLKWVDIDMMEFNKAGVNSTRAVKQTESACAC